MEKSNKINNLPPPPAFSSENSEINETSTILSFDDKKKHYIQEIQQIAKESFNDEQKKIVEFILESANENNIDSIYTFITQRVKTGFVFDAAPEVAHDCVSLCERDDKKSFGSALAPVHHKLIIGENYDVLKNLVATYTKNGQGLIDVIYIDPPYNTEKTKEDGNDYKSDVESSKFVYRDKFSRTGWLNMMKERLELARKLLSDKGVIFISIDDNEQAYLKVLCDEIFGENCFINQFVWKKNSSVKTEKTKFTVNTEYVLLYGKSSSYLINSVFKDLSASSQKLYNKDDNDGRGRYQTVSLQKPRDPGPETTYDYTDNTGKIWKCPENGWRMKYEKIKSLENDNRLVFTGKTLRVKDYWNERLNEGKRIDTLWDDLPEDSETINTLWDDLPENSGATKELFEIVQNSIFNNPKPSKLISRCLNIAPKNAIVLDFFAGSGTTGQAVMELNEEDGGNRQCILVTNNENNIATDVTYERLYRVVNGKGSKGESFSWKYSKDTPYLTNNYFDVFNTVSYELKIDDYEKAKMLLDKAKQEFKKLNPDYEAKDFDIYNQLASLKPYKK